MFQPEADTFRRLKAIILGSVLLLSFCTAQRAPQPVQPNRPPLRVGGDPLSPLPLLPHRLQPHCRPEPGFDGQCPGPPLYPPAPGALCLAALPERRPVVGLLAPDGDHGRGYRGVLRRPDLGQDQALSRGEPGEDLGRGGGGHGRGGDRRRRPGPLGLARDESEGPGRVWPCSWPWWDSWGTCSSPCSSARPRSRTPRRSSRATAACWTAWTACSSPPPWWSTSGCF